jgi:HD-like signal output (HDOD) protein
MTIEHSKSDEFKLPKAMLDKIEELPALPQVVGKIRQFSEIGFEVADGVNKMDL